jgi:hypothetical protein
VKKSKAHRDMIKAKAEAIVNGRKEKTSEEEKPKAEEKSKAEEKPKA